MRIAVVGAEGQLGRELRELLGERAVPLTHAELELTDAGSVDAAVGDADANAVINAAAYNLVDRAEDEPAAAFAVNGLGPRNLALACRSRDIPLLHVSTDYVFSGRVSVESFERQRAVPYRENARPEPLSAYGVSKLAGEHLVRSLCPKHFVVRTCGLYGPTNSPGSGNFVQTMLRLGRERSEVSVVDDQTCSPTSTADLARAIEALIATDDYGLYHAANAGGITWCGFAREIFQTAGIDVTVRPITSAEFGAKAARPRYSVLDSRKLFDVCGWEMPTREDALRRYLAQQEGMNPSQ